MEPPYTKTPNGIYAAIPDMSEAELKCTMALVRQTYGYHTSEVRATYGDLQKWTGLSRQGIADGLAAVKERGFFAPNGKRSMWETVRNSDQNSQEFRPKQSGIQTEPSI